ncbi:M16 family metallopeptidase [Peptostreptococcus faecalis]|uniref:M16 family metallopeptidase n=1 Tax=Peptostreptococcus faecalis TaxID=2045015 RepID=UPI000C7A26C7|nr:pitrilysin family protein [Peptostreptococcus faecalis]
MVKYKTLKNGLRIVGEELPYVRSISLGIWIDVGSRFESEEQSGVSHFIEHMLFKGTKNRSAIEIAESIENYGGWIEAYTTHDDTCYYVKMPSNHIDTGIDVLSDIMKNSLFDKKEIEKEKTVILDELRMYKDSSEDYLYEELTKRVYNNKGVGKKILGSEDNIKAITREKLTSFFDTHYVANNAVIVVCGNFEFEEMVKKIEEKFSSWKSNDIKTTRENQEFLSVKYIENKNDEQSNIAILFKAPNDENKKDFYAVKLLADIVGGSSSSRLFQNIREKQGLTYNIYADETYYFDDAEFGIYSTVAPENLKEVYDLIMNEIDDLKNNYVSKEELSFAKEKYKGSIYMELEDTEDRLQFIGESEIRKAKFMENDEIIKMIDSIDLDYMKNIMDSIFKGPMAVGITGKSANEIMNTR